MDSLCMTILWAISFVVFVCAEIATANALISVWFAVGALTAMFFSIAECSFLVQFSVFVGVSALTLAVTRPIVKKFQGKKHPTNLDLDIGEKAVVIEDIINEESKGRVKLNGTYWSAKSEDDSIISKGTIVTVKKVNGSKLMVSK